MRFQVMTRLARSERVRALLGIWLVSALTVGPTWLEAATYYVNRATGDNTRSQVTATNSATPWQTITHALLNASSGDTINVASGTYDVTNNPAPDPEAFPLNLKSGVKVLGAGSGSVTTVNITNGGTGYTDNFDVSFTGGGGSMAEGFAVVSGGAITNIIVTSGGGGYTSAPTVDLSAGAGTGGTATATVGAGTSTVSAPEGKAVFFSNADLSNVTEVSGFLLKHDASSIVDYDMQFIVGAGVDQSPNINHNAFLDPSATDWGIYVTDASSSDGSFLPTIDGNTMSGLAEGIYYYLDDATSDYGTAFPNKGGAGDHFGGTISNNTFGDVDYPLDFSWTSDNGGTIDPNVHDNITRGGTDSVYVYGYDGSDMATIAPTFSNNTFLEPSSEGIFSTNYLYSGSHSYSGTFHNNTITSPGTEGISLNFSMNSSTGLDTTTVKPVITNNTITAPGGTSDYGIDITLGDAIAPVGVDMEFSPTIDNNTIDSMTSYAIFLTLSSLTQGHLVSNVSISGNKVTDSASIYAELSEFYDANPDGYEGTWAINNNTVTGGTSYGIEVTISSLTGPASGFQNTTISGNTVDGAASSAIFMELSPGTDAKVATTTTITGNTTTNSDYGIDLTWYEMDNNPPATLLIMGNTATGNTYSGLYLNLSSQTSLDNDYKVSENFFDNNGTFGIEIYQIEKPMNPMIFSCNTVTNNDSEGVHIGVTANITTSAGNNSAVNFGDSTVASPGHNQFHDNNGGTYDFYNNSTKDIKAENNWWGTTATATIDSHIYDKNDNGAKGTVDYTPVLTAAVVVSATPVVLSSIVDDADTSNTATVGDTLRFCTTVTAGADCGPSAITLKLDLPGNVTLVPGSVNTNGNGGVDPNQPAITVTGITLGENESADVCFDVVVDSGTDVVVTATASAANMTDASDTETVTLGTVLPPAPVPTLGEWARIFIPLLLLAVGVIASRRRRGMIAMILASAFLITVPARIANAAVTHQKTAKADKIKNEIVTIDAVNMKDKLVTLHLADGREFTVDGHKLHIKDKSVTGKDKKAQHQAEKAARKSAVSSSSVRPPKDKHHDDKITPQGLAERIQKNAVNAQSGASGQAAIIKVKYKDGEIRTIKVHLYKDLAQANAVVAKQQASRATAQSRKASKASNH